MSQLVFGAWVASGAVLFLPLGALLRLAARVRHRFRRRRASGEETAAAECEPVAEGLGTPAAHSATSSRAIRWSRAALTFVLYVGFVVGAMHYTPALLSRALDTEHPMASITSASMWPTLKKGDLVILKGIDKPEDINVGDIIAFEYEGGFAIHRVIQIDGDKITTQGDANPHPDPPITFEQVIGRMPKVGGRLVKIPYLGNVGILLGPLFGHKTSDGGTMSETTFDGQQPGAEQTPGSTGGPSSVEGS
jgi:signal peptidase I